MTRPYLGTRFLKDAMWKKDKKDFAREMGKLKRLKDQLVLMKQDFLAENEVRGRAGRAAGHQLRSRCGSRGGRDSHVWLHRRVARSGPIQKEPPSPPLLL